MRKLDHTKNIIEVENVSFSYGSNEVLKDITFNVHQGDYLGMVGPNGAGKTTLLKIILGLIVPNQGKIRIFGKDLKEFKDWSKISYVPQKATNFDANFPAKVEEVVLMGRCGKRGLWHRYSSYDKKQARAALEHVKMWEFKDRLIGDLSGGQQQRVFIARALASEPEIMFLDEPITGIDQDSQENFYSLLRELNKKLELTLVLVSHDVERIVCEAMHIACINHTLVCHSSPEDFVKESKTKSISGKNTKFIPPFHNHDH